MEAGAAPQEAGAMRRKVQEFERQLITEALRLYNGNMARAARSLGLSRAGLYQMMRRLRMDIDAARQN